MIGVHSVMLVAVISAVTVILRFLPFLVFGKKETPPYVAYLGRVLPYAIMGMLVVYCLKGISFVSTPFGVPELVSCLIVVLMHVWRRNTLLSIISGTACYMVMVQLVF